MELILQIGLLALGFIMLIKGADWFVEGTAGVAEKFGIPQIVIGLTIVAMGTSAPEAAVSITSALKGSAGIAIGNVIGSNILNVLVILGVTGTIVSIAIRKSTFVYEIPYMIIISVVLVVMGMTGGSINLIEGIMLWVLFIVYLLYLLKMAKNNKEENEEKTELAPTWKLIVFAIVGGILIVWGSNVTVNSATYIAKLIGLSDRFIGLTIVALGTSLPELVTSVTAALKNKADIAIGNIVGSNIFNMLFVIGTTALITPVTFEPQFMIDGAVNIGVAILLWVSVAKTKQLKRAWGVTMLAGYLGYFLYLIK